MKVTQEKEELKKMAQNDLLAHALDLEKQIYLKTVSARKNELKNVREIRAAKKRLARSKTQIAIKEIIKEKI